MKLNIVMFSNQPFDMPLKTNKWHVSTRLAGLGHKVIFVDPPTRFYAIKQLFSGKLSLKRFFTGVKKENENLYVYTPVHLFNFKPFSFLNTFFHSRRIKNLLKDFERIPKQVRDDKAQVRCDTRTVFWVYHFDYPDFENFIKEFNYDLFIYDVVDEYTAFPEYSNKKSINIGVVALIQAIDDFFQIKLNQNGLYGKQWVLFRERWLSKIANLVFVSAPGLIIKFEKIFDELGKDKKLINFLPNTGDYLRFKDVESLKNEVPEDMAKINRPRILFDGAIDSYKLNVTLVEKCAQHYPSYNFVLIGPEKLSDPDLNLSKLKAMKNVFFLGVKPYEQLPYYYAGADVYLIPYNLNDYTIGGCFPVKFHNALAAGLPTIVTNLPAYKPFSSVCTIAKNDDEFTNAIKTELETDSDLKKRERKVVSKGNSWDGKVASQLKLIETCLI